MKSKIYFKGIYLILMLFVNWAHAQNEKSFDIDASNPTNFYSFAEIAGGLSYEIEDQGGEGLLWHTGLNLSLAHKFLRVNARIPFTNESYSPSTMGDMELGLDVLAHKRNEGLYRATMLGFNATFPTANDGFQFLPRSIGFWEVNGTYTGALKLKPNLSLYPSFTFYHKRGVTNSYIFWNGPNGSLIPNPDEIEGLKSHGFRISMNLAHNISSRSFLQITPYWEKNTWSSDDENAKEILQFFNDGMRGYGLDFRYQFAVSPSFHTSVRYSLMERVTYPSVYRNQLFLGFTYYLR